MTDEEIVQCFLARQECAIAATSQKYGRYCTCIAAHIIGNGEDAEECVNDMYLAAWDNIPPQHPRLLKSFVGKITRNLALNRYKRGNTAKRGGSQMTLVLEELAECVSGAENLEDKVVTRQLQADLNQFLSELSPQKRKLFVGRYWYLDSLATIANKAGITENNAAVILSRLRKELKQYLNERGYTL